MSNKQNLILPFNDGAPVTLKHFEESFTFSSEVPARIIQQTTSTGGGIYLGGTPIEEVWVGSQEIVEVYVGSNLIWAKSDATPVDTPVLIYPKNNNYRYMEFALGANNDYTVLKINDTICYNHLTQNHNFDVYAFGDSLNHQENNTFTAYGIKDSDTSSSVSVVVPMYLPGVCSAINCTISADTEHIRYYNGDIASVIVSYDATYYQNNPICIGNTDNLNMGNNTWQITKQITNSNKEEPWSIKFPLKNPAISLNVNSGEITFSDPFNLSGTDQRIIYRGSTSIQQASITDPIINLLDSNYTTNNWNTYKGAVKHNGDISSGSNSIRVKRQSMSININLDSTLQANQPTITWYRDVNTTITEVTSSTFNISFLVDSTNGIQADSIYFIITSNGTTVAQINNITGDYPTCVSSITPGTNGMTQVKIYPVNIATYTFNLSNN